MFRFLLAWLASTVVLGSDSSDAPLTAEQARQHVMMVNERGQHLDPAAQWKLAKGDSGFGYRQNVAAIRKGIKEFYESTCAPGRTNQVVVFVHGGLNSYTSSKKRLAAMLSDKNQMLKDGYYPLLIVWNSGFVSSYLEHLLDVRQGEIWPIMGKVTAPVMLGVDLGRGLVRLPLTLGGRWYNDWETAELPDAKRGRTKAWEDLEARIEKWQSEPNNSNPTNSLIRKPRPEGGTRKWGERLFRLTCYFVTQPIKIAVLPLADGLATEAWDNMIRRTHTMFQPPEPYDFHREYRKAFHSDEHSEAELQAKVNAWLNAGSREVRPVRRKRDVEPDGSMYQFAQTLQRWSTNLHIFPHDLRWQFVGHSMGTMVLNELFRIAPETRAERITYMAAACSIRDFQEMIVPYLRRQAQVHSNVVPFYNLSLHRIRERDNSMDKIDLIPRGTLLNYIDAIFAKPATITDRTLGSWENVVRALPDLPIDLRPQIHNVCFDLLPWSFSRSNTNQPQNHSSFTKDFAFWKDEFVRGPQEKTESFAPSTVSKTPKTPDARQSPPLK